MPTQFLCYTCEKEDDSSFTSGSINYTDNTDSDFDASGDEKCVEGDATVVTPHGDATLVTPHGDATVVTPHGDATVVTPHGDTTVPKGRKKKKTKSVDPKPVVKSVWEIPLMMLMSVVSMVLKGVFRTMDLFEAAREEHRKTERRAASDLRRIALVMIELGEIGGQTSGRAFCPAFASGVNNDDVMWMVVDSGANRHYVCSEDFLTKLHPSHSMVYGVGKTKVQTKSKGMLRGVVRTATSTMPIEAQASCVPEADVSLFSVPMASRQGHSVVFEGEPDSGRHGMYVKGTDVWIPFTWDEGTGLWWLQVDKDVDANYGSKLVNETNNKGAWA